MKTTKEDLDAIRLDADKAEESSIDWIRERGLRFRRVLSDLSRLAEIEGARAKGGLTSGERAIVPETQGIIIRLDDALRAANEENERLKRVLSAIADHCDDDHAGAMERARKTLEEATP